MERYLTNLAKLPSHIGADGTLDLSDPELQGWMNRMLTAFVPSFEAGPEIAFQIMPRTEVSFSDGQKSVTVAMSPAALRDRSNLTKNPARPRDPKKSPAPPEEFTRSMMGSDFRCVLVGVPFPKATERLKAMEEATNYLEERFSELEKEGTRLMAQLVSVLEQMNLALDAGSA